MKQIFAILILLFLSAGCAGTEKPFIETAPDFAEIFAARGRTGAMVLYDREADRFFYYNEALVNRAAPPAATFHLLIALIGLETEKLDDEWELFKWDGLFHDNIAWNADHNLTTALRDSVDWFFDETAREVGPVRMNHYVDLSGYGNQETGDGNGRFWSDGRLRITPKDQVFFLVRFYLYELPFSDRSIRIVRNLVETKRSETHSVVSVTAVAKHGNPVIGWNIGWVETGGNTFFFALALDLDESDDPSILNRIPADVFQELGIPY